MRRTRSNVSAIWLRINIVYFVNMSCDGILCRVGINGKSFLLYKKKRSLIEDMSKLDTVCFMYIYVLFWRDCLTYGVLFCRAESSILVSRWVESFLDCCAPVENNITVYVCITMSVEEEKKFCFLSHFSDDARCRSLWEKKKVARKSMGQGWFK